MDRSGITDDLLVVDYTEYRQTHPQEVTPSKGVCFLDAPDKRIGAFSFLNPQNYPFDAINLEEHPALLTDKNGRKVRNVECICSANRKAGRRWVAFLELKYPDCEDNIPQNMADAFDKFEICIDTVMKDNHYLEGMDCNVYAIASHPEYEQAQPFGEFIYDQTRMLNMTDKGIILLHCNAVRISTPEYLYSTEVPARYKYSRP